jgi:hypothetical protein
MRVLLLFAVVWIAWLSPPVFAQQTFNASLVSVFEDGIQSENIILQDSILYRVHIGFIEAFNVSNPLNPVFLDTLDWWAYPPVVERMAHLLIYNGLLVAVTRQTGMRIIDISNPREMSIIASFDYQREYSPMYADVCGIFFLSAITTVSPYSIFPICPMYAELRCMVTGG